ncbi:thiamine phosphate synthase [Alcanivorax sediminis]|uniref:Thiamine-phosphate synthase n=1 Tax=Alcanivorax sediminis TaxID=2663008 RepID=A0A6N7LTA2_9GAMM|nr:thiamine phosphate synthase [Alcanivorax sediminis]MQX51621.1 thiamine phosphate synthase [Alcanivorax sediminis]
MTNKTINGLYAITDPALTPDERLLPAVEAALFGGARLLQYRDKTASADQRRRRASQLRALCHEYDALFIVNDDPALAAEVGADGVHIGQSDGGIATARALLGDNRIIGVTCHGDLRLARQAADAGADYLAMGRFFASRTKPQAPPADIASLKQACDEFPLPVVAIGGVNADNAPLLIQAGAASVAVIEALFGHSDPADIEAAARRISDLF